MSDVAFVELDMDKPTHIIIRNKTGDVFMSGFLASLVVENMGVAFYKDVVLNCSFRITNMITSPFGPGQREPSKWPAPMPEPAPKRTKPFNRFEHLEPMDEDTEANS